MCLPGKGVTDFEHLLKRLHGANFDGALILEVYTDDYKKEEELFSSLEYINNLSQKIFK
jgi:sugar phosphate isomerase/epimerase